jgi:hypothetical protein
VDVSQLKYVRRLNRGKTPQQQQRAIEIAKEKGIIIGRNVITSKIAWVKLVVEDMKIEFFWP